MFCLERALRPIPHVSQGPSARANQSLSFVKVHSFFTFTIEWFSLVCLEFVEKKE